MDANGKAGAWKHPTLNFPIYFMQHAVHAKEQNHFSQPLLDGVSIVVPVYNSENTLAELCGRVQESLSEHSKRFEIIFVDDGSADNSWEEIESLAESNSAVRGVSLMRNFGQHNALVAGVRLARYSTTVTLDDDLQHPPEEIPKILAKLNDGYHVIYGTPVKEPHGFFRAIASRIAKITLAHVLGAEAARNVSAFRAFRTDLRRAFSDYSCPYVSFDVLLSWGASRFGTITTVHDQRKHGKSNYTTRKLLQHSMTLVTGFSVLPLKLASIMGFIFTGFGIVVLLYVIINYFLSRSSIAGFPFLASTIAIFSGAQLFFLGIIGEYLARMHFRLMERPIYVIGRTSQINQ